MFAINTTDTALKIKKTSLIKKPFTNYKKHKVKSTIDLWNNIYVNWSKFFSKFYRNVLSYKFYKINL